MEEQANTPPSQNNPFFSPFPVNLPNATTVLVLGILSIVFSCWYLSPVGIVLSIISLVFASKDTALYLIDPNKFSLSSFNNLKAGRVCAIIGLVLGCIMLVIGILVLIGVFVSFPFWGMTE